MAVAGHKACILALISVVCICGAGCATALKKENKTLQGQVMELQTLLSQKENELVAKNEELKAKQDACSQKDVQLKERDAAIEALKGQLRSFGVFQ